jgi:hypothetical protein
MLFIQNCCNDLFSLSIAYFFCVDGSKFPHPNHGLKFPTLCRNPSFGLSTKAKGVARLRAKRKEARESRQRHSKSAGQEEARELKQEEARESHHILQGVLESVREYERVNPPTPKATPTWGDEVPVDF